jgi:hypothetical protein
MPRGSPFPSSSRGWPPSPCLLKNLSFSVLLALTACGSSTGDFGRPAPGYVNSSFWPLIATATKFYRDQPESYGANTDDERELRDRAYHFLMPEFPQNKFDDMMAEMRVQGILPPVTGTARELYLGMLLSRDPFRSLSSRYRRLSEDIENDRLLIVSFKQTYQRVTEADRIRERSFAHVTGMQPEERIDAVARMRENTDLNAWVHRDLCYRIEMYRYALQRLVLMGPMREAIYAERALGSLGTECPAAHVEPAGKAWHPLITK